MIIPCSHAFYSELLLLAQPSRNCSLRRSSVILSAALFTSVNDLQNQFMCYTSASTTTHQKNVEWKYLSLSQNKPESIVTAHETSFRFLWLPQLIGTHPAP